MPRISNSFAVLFSSLAACGGAPNSSSSDEVGESETSTGTTDSDGETLGSSTSESSSTDDTTIGETTSDTTSESTSDTTSETTTEESETTTTDETGADLCGNAMLDPGETCDDANALPDDGCAANCVIECGYLCLELGTACIPGFHAVQCAAGPNIGQPSPVPNTCRLATLSVDGSHLALSPETTLAGQPRHLDAMFTDPSNAVFGFAGDTQDLATGSQLVSVDVETAELTALGPSLGDWVMGAAMNDEGELWVTTFDTYELNANSQVRIAQVDPGSGEFLSGPTLLTENGMPVTVWSIHVSDVAFRFDGAMFVSANEPGPPPPEPLSRYLEVDPLTASVVSAVDGPDDIYAAGIVFVGEAEQIIAMDIRGEDDIFLLDLAVPPLLDETLLYADPIPTNSGTADLAGCATLDPQ